MKRSRVVKEAKQRVMAKAHFMPAPPTSAASSGADTPLIEAVRAVLADPAYACTLSKEAYARQFMADVTRLFVPVPEELGDALSGVVRRTIGMVQHTSWMRIGMAGETLTVGVYFKPAMTDAMMQVEIDSLKKKVKEKFKERKVISYNCSGATKHEMSALPMGGVQIMVHMRILPGESDDDDDDDADSNDDDESADDAESSSSSSSSATNEAPMKKAKKE